MDDLCSCDCEGLFFWLVPSYMSPALTEILIH